MCCPLLDVWPPWIRQRPRLVSPNDPSSQTHCSPDIWDGFMGVAHKRYIDCSAMLVHMKNMKWLAQSWGTLAAGEDVETPTAAVLSGLMRPQCPCDAHILASALFNGTLMACRCSPHGLQTHPVAEVNKAWGWVAMDGWGRQQLLSFVLRYPLCLRPRPTAHCRPQMRRHFAHSSGQRCGQCQTACWNLFAVVDDRSEEGPIDG